MATWTPTSAEVPGTMSNAECVIARAERQYRFVQFTARQPHREILADLEKNIPGVAAAYPDVDTDQFTLQSMIVNEIARLLLESASDWIDHAHMDRAIENWRRSPQDDGEVA